MKKRTYKPFSPKDIKTIVLMNDEGKSNAKSHTFWAELLLKFLRRNFT